VSRLSRAAFCCADQFGFSQVKFLRGGLATWKEMVIRGSHTERFFTYMTQK
jgi:hypothetical protein